MRKLTNKIFVCIFVFIVFIFVAGCDEFTEEERIVSKVDHVMIVTKEAEGLKNFMSNVLQLPESWPYMYMNGFYTGGVFAGNVRIEAANSDTYISDNVIGGFALEPFGTGDEVIEKMNSRRIKNEVLEVHEQYRTINVNSILPGSWIFFCEYFIEKEKRDKKWAKEKAMLEDIDGGPLGINCVDEIKVVVDSPDRMKNWKKFFFPYVLQKGRYFKIDDGPAISFSISDKNHIKSIMFDVKSLSVARNYLRANNILGRDDKHIVATDPGKTYGVLFEFSESH